MPVSKKTPRRRVVKKEVVEEEMMSETAMPETKMAFTKNNKLMWGLAGVLLLVIVGAGLYNYKDLFVAAMVNGKLVSRMQLDRELEKQAGKDTLEGIITKELILQEAIKQKVTVESAEIETKLGDIEKQVSARGAKLDDLLAAQGQTRDSLKDQLHLQTLVEKMVGKDLQVGEDEIKKYFETNVGIYPKGTTLDAVKEEIKAQLTQQKMSEKVNTWIEGLRKEAKIETFLKF